MQIRSITAWSLAALTGTGGGTATPLPLALASDPQGDRMSRMGGSVEEHLAAMADAGGLTSEQLAFLVLEYRKSVSGAKGGDWANRERERPGRKFARDEVLAYLRVQTERGEMTEEAAEYVGNLLRVGYVDSGEVLSKAASAQQLSGPVAASYMGNGNVELLGRWGTPYSSQLSQCSSTSSLWNGIWGVALGQREYALQCSSSGLSIVDVTDPTSPFRVQFIQMNDGVIWRDVATRTHADSGKTYAYVAADGGDDFYVVDLSYLSTSASAPDGTDSDPIPLTGYVNRGHTNNGHTLSLDADAGLLFLNNANKKGCMIFDLLADPWNPRLLSSWSGRSRDCHDSFARDGMLYSADGNSGRYRVLDIAGVRGGGGSNPDFLGETTSIGAYAHSAWLTEDSRYMFGFEEDNEIDIVVFDVSDSASPMLLGNVQWSGDQAENSLVHNGQVRGNYLMVAYYEAGLRVFDISNTLQIEEVGKYETFRDPDGTGTLQNYIGGRYCGAWNLHTSLPSGNVLVSDATYGLFIVRVGDGTTAEPTPAPEPTTSEPTSAPVPATTMPTSAPVPATAMPTSAPVVACGSNRDPCSTGVDCCSGKCKNGTCKGNGRRLGQGPDFVAN